MSLASGLQSDSDPGRIAPSSKKGEIVARLPQMPELPANLSAQGIASGDLALDLLLHDIAERAVQTTGASGAAIALERDDAMVCRAAAGSTAPDLGVKINIHSGLTGACVRERKLQWCRDTENDTRVDADASRALGVRSILVIPVFLANRLGGVVEAFSPEPDAFRDEHVKALEEIARWISDAVRKNAPLTEQPVEVQEPVEKAPLTTPVVKPPAAQAVPATPASNPTATMVRATAMLLAKHDRSTQILRGIAIALAILLAGLLISRWLRHDNSARQVPTVAQAAQPTESSPTALADNVMPEMAVGKVKPESGKRRGPASNASLRSYDTAGANNDVVISRTDKRDRPSDTQDAKSQDGPAPQPKPAAESSKAIPDQELAAVGPPNLRSVPSAMAPSVKPPTVDIPAREVSQGVVEGRLIHSVQPKYPTEAMMRHTEGLVVLHAIIGKDGAVRQVKSVRGDATLSQAAVSAVQQWRYEPYKLNGVPVDMPIDITINFNMPK